MGWATRFIDTMDWATRFIDTMGQNGRSMTHQKTQYHFVLLLGLIELWIVPFRA